MRGRQILIRLLRRDTLSTTHARNFPVPGERYIPCPAEFPHMLRQAGMGRLGEFVLQCRNLILTACIGIIESWLVVSS